jgi:manganese oxidase
MRRTDPERDPLFRALVVAMAVALVVALAFDALGRREPAAEASGSTPASPSSPSTMSGMDGSGSMASMSAPQMAVMHERSMKAYPAKTRGQGNQVLRPAVAKGVKVFHLMAMPVRWETAPGQFATAMAYNDQVPGPQIRVHRGDTVRVILTNHLDQPTVIHWHGLTVPNSMDGVPYVPQDPVMPGKTFTYQFRVVDPPGTYLYHSHFNSTEQVGDGLYGAFVIEPKHAAWDAEYTEILNDRAG